MPGPLPASDPAWCCSRRRVATWSSRYRQGLDGMANAEPLPREVAATSAYGRAMPPVVVFAGAGHEVENRMRALRLDAIGYACEWPLLMSVIERVLAEA